MTANQALIDTAAEAVAAHTPLKPGNQYDLALAVAKHFERISATQAGRAVIAEVAEGSRAAAFRFLDVTQLFEEGYRYTPHAGLDDMRAVVEQVAIGLTLSIGADQ